MKIKTLKDLDLAENMDRRIIKAEAIKWVKMMMRGRSTFHTYIEDFKMFHNITEEDLK